MTARCGCGRALDDVGLHGAPYTELCTGRNTRPIGAVGIGRVARLGRTLDTGGSGPVVGDHLGDDGVHRVFRDASPRGNAHDVDHSGPRVWREEHIDPITHFRIDQRIGLAALAEGATRDWLADQQRRELANNGGFPAAWNVGPIRTNDSHADEHRHDIPLTARDRLVIALAAATVTALILRAIVRRWWWTA